MLIYSLLKLLSIFYIVVERTLNHRFRVLACMEVLVCADEPCQ